MLGFFLTGVASIPFTYNFGFAEKILRQLLLFYVLLVGTNALVKTPRDALPILYLFVWQFAWWGFHGGTRGYVLWHPSNGNQDGFGSLMAMGLGLAYYFGLSVKSRRLRLVAHGLTGLAAVGIVGSFARGAFLASGLVMAYVWFRSPRKGSATINVLVAVVVVVVASNILYPDGSYWREIRSAFTEGTTVGTGEDRWEMWRAGLKVFGDRPLIGTGPRNFGPYASTILEVGEVGGRFRDNPGRIYDRALHSAYMTVLVEFGLVGSALFLWMLVEFWRMTAWLQRPRACERWSAGGGRKISLRHLSYGLEAMMIAFLGTGLMYDTLYTPWFWTLFGVASMLYHTTVRESVKSRRRRRSLRSTSPNPVSVS